MLHALLTGALAGFGIAIPVGAIAVLIVETGMRCGFRCAAFAGAGAATADLLYASAAALGGAALAGLVEAGATPFRFASAAVLAAMALSGLRRVRAVGVDADAADRMVPDGTELARTYLKFLGLTVINPLTVIYFTVSVVGLGVAQTLTGAEAAVFAVGAFAASLSWQTLLAAIGAVAHRRLPPAFRVWATVGGNLIVLALAVVVVLR